MLLCLVAVVAASCIENDLSAPNVPADILSLELAGQKSLTIDAENRTIDVVMGELADMSSVEVVSYTLSDDADVVGGMPEYLDLRNEVNLTLRIYKDYVWTIRATQPIERYIRCDDQIGEAELDVRQKIANVYVSKETLSDIRFIEMKLEPEGSVITRTLGFVPQDGNSVPETLECQFPMTLNCVLIRYFFVEYEGREIRWQVKVQYKPQDLEVVSVNAWTCSAWVKGTNNGTELPMFEYCKAGSNQWTSCGQVTMEGSSVTAEIRGLEPETEYSVRITNGETFSEEKNFTTGKAEQLVNSNFDLWYMDGKAWMPNESEAVQVWDTANPGSAAIGTVPTVPEESIVVKGKSVKMETLLTDILGIKKLAAGNIYTGKFDKLAGLGAELDWGVPFGARPIALRGYYKYTPATINVVEDKDYAEYEGQPDQCQIQIFLAEWTKPFHVNSAKKQFVDKNDASIIAFSELYTSESQTEYKKFTLPIVYNDNRMPTYIIISACASRFGNYFVGGEGSLLYVDEFELVYDPSELTEDEYAQVFSKIKPI